MVKLNPDVQTSNIPDYLTYPHSNPITPYSTDVNNRTLGVALAGAGSVLKEAVTGADEVIKSLIYQGLYKDLNTNREVQTGALEQMAGIPPDQRVSPYQSDNNVAPAATSGGSSMNIIPGATAEPVPEELQSMDRPLTSANIGTKTKPSMLTYYTGIEDDITKKYRARWGEGYGDYIDTKVAEITGGNPANKRLLDLMNIVKENNSVLEKDRREAIQHGFGSPHGGFATTLKKILTPGTWESKNPLQAVANWEAPHKDVTAELNNQQRKNEGIITGNKVDIIENSRTANDAADKIDMTYWKQIEDGLGINGLKLAERNVQNVPPPDPQKAGETALAIGVSVSNAIKAELNKSGVGRVLGDEEVNKIAAARQQKYKDIADLYLSDKHGSAHEVERQISQLNNKNIWWLMTDKDSPIRDFIQMEFSLAKAGPAMQGVLSQFALRGTYLEDAIGAFSAHNVRKMMTQDMPLPQIIDYLRNKGVGDPNSPNGNIKQREVFHMFTNDLADMVADPTLDSKARAQLAKNIFQGNVVAKFDNDYVDDNGKLIPGKQTVFRNMTKDSVRNEVWNLAGGSSNAPLWVQYKNWVSDQSRNLLAGNIKDLDAVAINPNIKYSWDTDKSQLKVDFKPEFYTNPYIHKGYPEAGPLTIPEWWRKSYDKSTSSVIKSQENAYRKTVADFNTSITPLVSFAKKEGSDPNGFVLRQMDNSGFDFNKISNSAEVMKTIMGPSPFDKKPPEPAASKGKGVKNLGSDTISGIKVDQIPEGMSARDFIKQLQSRTP